MGNLLDQKLVLKNINQQIEEKLDSVKALKKRFEFELESEQAVALTHDQLFNQLTSNPDDVDLNDYFEDMLTKKDKMNKKQKKIHKKSSLSSKSQRNEIELADEEQEEEEE